MQKVVAIVTTVLALSACGKKAETPPATNPSAAQTTTTAAPTPAPPPAAPAKELTPEQAAGQPIYDERCARCHGDDGNTPKNGVVITSAAVQKKPDAELVKFLLGPKAAKFQMSHTPAPLTEDEAKKVVAYMRALAPS